MSRTDETSQQKDTSLDGEARLHGEESIIQPFLAPLARGYPGAYGLLDDCAAITPTPGYDLIVKTDPVAAGIHFLPDDAPEDIAWKALAVNVSDLAAKAAVPRAYLMALSFPEAPTRDWMAAFAQGLGEAQAAFGMHLIGGDTDRRPGPVTISITVFGEVPTGRMVRRGTAGSGDLIYVTGTLGMAALGLALRRDPARSGALGLERGEADAAIGRYLRPRPRLGLRSALLAHARAAMDLSDGLAKDLGRMAHASGCGAVVRMSSLPLAPVMAQALSADHTLWSDVVGAGDDYELLVAIPPEYAAEFELAASAAGAASDPTFAVTCIGEMTAGPEIEFLDADQRPFHPTRSGWDHF